MTKPDTPDIVERTNLAVTEEWRPVVDWSAYEVSNFGRVRSVDRMVPNGHGYDYFMRGRLLTARKNPLGYCIVTLRHGQRERLCPFVHRLVAQSFIRNPESKPYVNHIDCDPSNNHVENLEWCTQAENLAHMDKLGRRVNGMKGRRSPVAALTDADVRSLRDRWVSGRVSFQKLGHEFGISKRSAMRCAKRESYTDVQ